MNFLVVSDREYKKTSRGIDIITAYLSEKGHKVDHFVFYKRKKICEKIVSDNIRQLYLYDSIKLYRGKLQFLFPGFILLFYFNHIIRNASINFQKYDYVILESGHPIYLASLINNKIIYRQSDPASISFNSNRKFYRNLEANVIKKSLFVSSALDQSFFNHDFLNKTYHWHSGFIPYEGKFIINNEKSIVILGGELDWRLIYIIAKKHPDYQFIIIGTYFRKSSHKNIIIKGYLEYSEYQKILLSASATFIPFSNHYTYQLREVSYTAKILVSMQLGMPILLKAYGNIKTTDTDKKLFIYNTHKEAFTQFDSIIDKIECGELNREVSEKTQYFLTPQTAENRLKELDAIFSKLINV